ncbi:LANO_0G01222g1_1 [Lachancea nothofagi CBS 11611]|uniref:LANO_0G01222g1_1 n=1 Tax=Lachancea nothofagi CBS 11611 TaxID=1266666 RepID=A0A1G4KET0_9SACH|nr:LANO_0G01222g1_1 [Lachancea nothofagi CBS 11611]
MTSITNDSDATTTEDVTQWGIEEVLIWCEQKVRFGSDAVLDQVRDSFRENEIDGASLLELDLNDCKQLTDNNSKLAVQLKLEINRLKHQKRSQEDEILTVLSQLYSTVSDKLQDFQSQYARLRLDVLEVVKKDSLAPQIQTTQSGAIQSQHQQPQHDYFEGHRVVTPGSPNTPAVRQGLNNSTTASQQSLTAANSTTPTTLSATQHAGNAGSEPLKHMRASKEDSCERILKSAMKRHGLSEQDWRQYVLVICYGDQERMLELDEKPVQIFKNLKQQGLHPAIMLRQSGDFEEVNGGLTTPGGRL